MDTLSDIREDIVAKKIERPSLEYAGFWRRLMAALIDLFTITIICSIIILIFQPFHWPGFGNLWGNAEVFNESPWDALPSIIGGNVLSILVNITYFVVFWVWRGQTPGKMLLGVKIIKEDGSGVSISVALLRYLGYIVSIAVAFIGFIWVAFDNRKQGFHDKMAETLVVIIPATPITAPVTKAST
jgi:uncharacterized RDD family membrane protein YckC